jgi:hypothetical protein
MKRVRINRINPRIEKTEIKINKLSTHELKALLPPTRKTGDIDQ